MKKSPLRKQPTQDRSRRRLESILAAAASLFAEHGFEATTVEAIAEEAGTSVGSVYQFFEGKLAIFRSLSLQCNERVRAAYTALIGSNPAARPIEELIDAVVDGIYALMKSDQVFHAIWKNTQLFGEIAEDDMEFERDLVSFTVQIVAAHAPHLPEARRAVVAELLVQTVSSGLFLLFRSEVQTSADDLISELKVMLKGYVKLLNGG